MWHLAGGNTNNLLSQDKQTHTHTNNLHAEIENLVDSICFYKKKEDNNVNWFDV
jgi:hypothetical protein